MGARSSMDCERQRRHEEERVVLLTVGTTRFDALSKAADSASFVRLLGSRGYTGLVLQIGNSETFFPSEIFGAVEPAEQTATVVVPLPKERKDVTVTYFRYAPTLKERIDEASLVISHAGAGSIFESLRAGKRVIAVPNSELMDNHQEELCVHLQGKGYLDVAAVDGLEEAVWRIDGDGGWMKRYVRDDGRGIGRAIGEDYVRRRGRG